MSYDEDFSIDAGLVSREERMFTDAYIATTAAERRASAAAQIRVEAMNLALRLPTDSTALADAKKIVASAGAIERYLMGKTARSRPVTKKKKK